MKKTIYCYGNGTFFDQIKQYGQIVNPITLCGKTRDIILHTAKSKVNCPDCKKHLKVA
jgi:hypothetical protein